MILGSGLLTSSWPKASDWLIRDEFTDTRAAGSVDGTAATPGPGTRTVTDTENKLSVGSGVMALAGGKASPGLGDPGLWYGAQSRTIGLAFVAAPNISSGLLVWGFDNNQSAGGETGFYFDTVPTLRVLITGGTSVIVGAWANSTAYKTVTTVKTNGALYFIRGGAFADWTLLWVDYSTTTASIYPGVGNYSAVGALDYLRVLQLPAPFDTDDGLATDTHAGSVSAGTTFGHEADALIEFTVTTLATSGYMSLQFRYVDANNFWLIEIEGGSGSLRLYERVSGAYSQRGFAASAVSDGTRIVVIAENQSISVYADNTKLFTYANATNFATATAGLTGDFGTGGAISDLITWPRTLSGTAASILDKVSA